MRIAVVSNKQNLKINYSNTIDSCDKVIRVNKMDNLDSGLSGERTDIAVVSTSGNYFSYSPQQRHVDVLKKCEHVYFLGGPNENYAKQIGLKNYSVFDHDLDYSSVRWTAVVKAVILATYLFPEAEILFLGDWKRVERCTSEWHNRARAEDFYFEVLREKGKLIPLIYEN